MDLEVVGCHALLFDDDAAAAFVNSGNALVEWHSLQIDRYDVRHLLSAPPASRRRNRSGEIIIFEDPSLQSQLDKERYLDLPPHSNQPEVEDDQKPLDTGGYRAVAFSYGNSDDSADQKNPAAGMESYGFLPPFPLPGNLLQSLPPTEKAHQIIARTAIFVSKHGGQSEIVLRVKQGDNPTFGFLMPDHHLHPYFRFLVDHPDLLNSELDGRSLDEGKKDGSEHTSGGALSLLGSVYGSGEEEDGNDGTKAEKDVQQDIVNQTISHDSKKMESKADSDKDESAFRNPIMSNREKIISVKKNSSIPTSRSLSVQGNKKEGKSSLFSTTAGEVRSPSIEVTSKIEPLTLEPPPELKRLIEKLVEFIMRNGKQFEATLLEQDSKHGRFSFLLPTDQYHSYYLKVLQTAQESKAIGKASNSGKRKASTLKEQDNIPIEPDRKEKFKMVIGKSKKETQETESKGTQNESGTTVDAAAAAAILHAATRGIKNSNSSVVPLTEEQKLKTERLKRAKLFVAMLKSGAAPFKTGASCGSSMEPLEPGAEVNLNSKKREASLAPADDVRPVTGEKPEKNYFDEEQSERFSKRKYRSKSDICEEDDDEERCSRRKYRSKSRRHEDDDKNENTKEIEWKHYRRRHQSHSSSQENKDDTKSSEEDSSNNKPYKSIHRSHHSQENNSEYEDTDLRRSTKNSPSHHSSHGSSRNRRASKHIHEEDEPDNDGKVHKHSKKKHHSSHRSKDKHGHSSKDKQSKRHHKHHSSSNDDSNLNKRKERELEEGEISSRVSQESRDIATGHVNREKSVGAAGSHQRALSQPAETIAEVPNDLRAKVRAMLMATRM